MFLLGLINGFSTLECDFVAVQYNFNMVLCDFRWFSDCLLQFSMVHYGVVLICNDSAKLTVLTYLMVLNESQWFTMVRDGSLTFATFFPNLFF